jgi:FimV-like protein
MTARFPILQAATRSGSQQIAAAVAIAFVGSLSIPTATYAQTPATGAASAAVAASATAGASTGGAQFTVQPGQSLNDAAIAMTQSHDRTVLARAAKVIFDANPNAFMGHDPSRLRLGAVLNLPAVDATGAPVGAASAPASASAASGAAAQAAASNNASATTSAAAPAATTAAASGAGASSAAATTAAAPATQGVSSTPATAEATSSTPAAGAQPTSGAVAPSASAASGTHSYTGSIQGSESAATSPSAPAANNGQSASQARPSSLQQLLALKNRVLMELQKHGIGKQQPGANENGTAVTGAQQPSNANAAPGASAPAHAAPSAAPSAHQQAGIPQEYLAAAGIVGAALVALLAGLTMRRRRRAARAQEAARADVAREDDAPHVAPAAAAPVAVAPDHEAPSAVKAQPDVESHGSSTAAAAAYEAAANAAEREAELKSEPETFHTASAEAALEAAGTLGADALPRESLDPAREEARAAEAAELEQAAREQALTPDEATASTSATELSLDETPIHEPVEPHFVEPIEALHDESGAKPRPFVLDLGPAPGSAQLEPTFEQPAASAAPPIQLSHVEPAAQHEQLIEPQPDAVDEAQADTDDEAGPHAPSSLPLGAPPPLEPAVPDEFPREAMRALDSIDEFALPPRTEPFAPAAAAMTAPGSLATQPVVAPEITAQQAVPSHAPQARAAADEIIAGTAGAAAVAGLGASRFGALKLDFDLELPPSPAQAVPSFTQDEIARIARNKLDLAAEYIDLGDVVGARTLINEVIESNDADTRADARVLLSTLAPLT